MAQRAATQHQPYQPGDLVAGGKYRVEAFIGAGAFGQVYRVRHLGLDGARALKVIRKDALGVGSTGFADYRDRLRQEFRLAERVKDANVIAVYDLVEDDEALYAEMELAEGGSVADLLRSGGPLPIAWVVGILRGAARGLAALHRAGVVHRDVKPANILLLADGTAKIADLGLAQWGGSSDSVRSVAGSLAPLHPGTPDYMSPEHRWPDPLPPTSDLYSLGCTAFEMLTGRVWKQVRHEVADAAELRPDTPAWLNAVVTRLLREAPGLMAADREDATLRYVRAGDLLGAMDEGQAGGADGPDGLDGSVADPGGRRRGDRRWRWAAGAGAAGIVVAAIIVFSQLWQGLRKPSGSGTETPVAGPSTPVTEQPEIQFEILIDRQGRVTESGSSALVKSLEAQPNNRWVDDEEGALVVALDDQVARMYRRYRVSDPSQTLVVQIVGKRTTVVWGRAVVIVVAENTESRVRFVDKNRTQLANERPADRPRRFSENIICLACTCIDALCPDSQVDDYQQCAKDKGTPISDDQILFVNEHSGGVTDFMRFPAFDLAVIEDSFCGAGAIWQDILILNGQRPDAIIELSEVVFDNKDQWTSTVERRLGTSDSRRGFYLWQVELHDDGATTVTVQLPISECGACDEVGDALLAIDLQPSGEIVGPSVRAIWGDPPTMQTPQG